jgi:hypothetical protein
MSAPAFKEILLKVAGPDRSTVESEINRFIEWFPSFEKGGGFTVIWTKDKTRVEHQQKEGASAPFESNAQFGNVLIRVWFGAGAEPELEKELLNSGSTK